MPSELIFTGDWRHKDFCEIVDRLPSSTRFVPIDADSPARTLSETRLIVLAQSQRGQFAPRLTERWRNNYSQTPAVQLLGSWCEGEMRSGEPLSGWHRVYWHRWATEFAQFQANPEICWPALAAKEFDKAQERIPQKVDRLPGGHCLSIGVVSKLASELEMIRVALEFFGHQCSAVQVEQFDRGSLRELGALVVVGDSFDPWLRDRLEKINRLRRRIPILTLLNFPRTFELEAMKSARGPQTIMISKPFDLGQLQQALLELTA